ncbi:MAG TPA: PEP-CTERM sorting domain-containing protein [Bryobacteraceae bacterium]|nr:PEP-CTERM sorting domain-containing protein [Bryobacteraceae bacterium]
MRPYFSKLGLLLVPTLALFFSSAAHADILAPGTAGGPDIFSFVCPAECPTLLALVETPFSNANESGDVLAGVISDPNNTFGAGNLDFVYQIVNNPGSIDGLERLVATSFTGYQTDVGFATNGSAIGNGFADGTVAPTGVDRPFANEVGFNFSALNTVAPGTDSVLLVVETNSTEFTSGTVAIIDGLSTNLAGFAPTGVPTPEPSMSMLVGLGLLALVGARKFVRAQ